MGPNPCRLRKARDRVRALTPTASDTSSSDTGSEWVLVDVLLSTLAVGSLPDSRALLPITARAVLGD